MPSAKYAMQPAIREKIREMRFEILEVLDGATLVHHVDPEVGAIMTRGRKILLSDTAGTRQLATFPVSLPRDLFNFSRLAQRAARADKCNVYLNRAGNMMGIRAGTVYAVRDAGLEALGKIQGDSVLHDGFAEDAEGSTYFGEYFRNPERGPVCIWRVDRALEHCVPAHQFAAGEVRHVHGVFADPYNPEMLWSSVGDLKGECHIICTSDRFASLKWYGDGTQKWRAVKLFFTPTHVCWITDSHLEQNYACQMDRKTGVLEVGQAVDCSGWYGTQIGNDAFLAATTVERGPGIFSDHSSLLFSRDGFDWSVIHRFKKDPYPMPYFKNGVINFPSGQVGLDNLYMSGEGLVGLDGKVMRATITV